MRGVPPGCVCGSGWLVFQVPLPSGPGGLGGNRALGYTAADLLGQYPLTMGPPWAPLFSQLDGLSSVGLPCGCWCLTCPSLPLSPSLSLSLLVIVALLSSSSVSPLPPSPSSPPFLLHLLSYVDGQGHSHRGFFSPAPKGVFGSAPGHSKGDAQSPRAGLGAGGLGLLSHLLSRLGRPRPPQCPAALVPSVDTEPS